MQLNITNVLLILLGATLVLCFILTLMDNKTTEGFDPVVDAIQSQLSSQTPAQLKSTISTLQQRLIDYGYSPDLNTYVKKTELGPNAGKCLVSNAEDRDKYLSKSDVPSPGPRIDLSQYVKKSSIPPEKICPAQQEIDYSAYVKKSTLPPNDKCPPCIAPKVKVSAGLCRECPPAPKCPPPERCPEIKCPPPAPCPKQKEKPNCDEVRYIKVPTLITKTVMVDANGSVISQQIDSGSASSIEQPVATQELTNYIQNTDVIAPVSQPSPQSIIANLFGRQNNLQIPSTTFPSMSINSPNITLAQTLDSSPNCSSGMYPSPDLNSDFKQYGIYGMP